MTGETAPKYKVGVALSGGGARGFAHLGALKALEEAGIKIDVLAGVSAGSVAAALFASGNPSEKVMDEFNSRKFKDFAQLTLRFSRHNGFFGLEKFEKFIADMVSPYKNLEELPIPTFIGVTNFDSGMQAEFHEGEIAPRVVASCSIPICFPPKEIDGVRYVDGGVVRNMPAWILRDKCEVLIGINCSPVLENQTDETRAKTLPSIVMRTFSLMSKANQKEDLKMCDVAIEFPEIAHYQVFNLKEINTVYLRGYATMRHALKHSPVLRKLMAQNN